MHLKYKQPNFYQFNEDSIKLSRWVIKNYSSNLNNSMTVLDLCCGCGVIGIEIKNSLKNLIRHITFLDKNPEFEDSLRENVIKNNLVECETKIIFDSLEGFIGEHKFDLIVSNPPYYDNSKFRKSSNVNRELCRSFEAGFLENFTLFIKKSLSRDGRAIFLQHVSNHKVLVENGAEIIESISEEVNLYSLSSFE